MSQTTPATSRSWAWPLNVNKTLLVLRLVLGGLFMAHGSQKLFGWFGGQGMDGFVASIQKMGLSQAPFWAYLSATTEVGAGLMLVLGLLTPLAAAGIIGDMLVATLKVHLARGFFGGAGGFEYNFVLIVLMAAIGWMGAGLYSLDARLGLALPRPATFLVALGAVLVVVGAALAGLP